MTSSTLPMFHGQGPMDDKTSDEPFVHGQDKFTNHYPSVSDMNQSSTATDWTGGSQSGMPEDNHGLRQRITEATNADCNHSAAPHTTQPVSSSMTTQNTQADSPSGTTQNTQPLKPSTSPKKKPEMFAFFNTHRSLCYVLFGVLAVISALYLLYLKKKASMMQQ